MDRPKVCAYTSLCEEDAPYWLEQYLAEVDRLQMPFAINLDRCSDETKKRATGHPLCVGSICWDDPGREFQEWDKQKVFNLIRGLGRFDWAMAWDADETWHRDFWQLCDVLHELKSNWVHQVQTPWVNLWEDKDHIRIDGVFRDGKRDKFCNLHWSWRFDHPITNGPKIEGVADDVFVTARQPIVCIHWGLMNHELRVLHKERWDRIYTRAVGNNPYGFWRSALDSTDAEVVKHDLM